MRFDSSALSGLLTRSLSLLMLLTLASGHLRAETVSVTVDPEKRGDPISKYIYGQFAEHLGHGIYGGIWVGEDSDIANTDGYRKDVLKALKALKVPVIRWPGGCFADEYHWRDGIGPRDERPVRVNTHWGGVEESNEFGTHEFFKLVEMLDTEAYVAGNLGSGTPQEMAEWLEYITADNNSSIAELRRKNGREEPWDVAFWGVGNESWGCGGNLRAEYYADLYRRFSTFLKAPEDRMPKLVASGFYDDQTHWTEALSKVTSPIDGISHHYYTLPTSDWDDKGDGTGFDEKGWISTLDRTLKIDPYIQANIEVLEKNNPEGNIGLYMDEWGTWYNPEPGTNPGFLRQQNTIRDAIVAAANFNIFHKYTDRVHMANIAQMVNVLQAMILTDGDKMLLTPTYHAFRMYIPFQDSVHVPLEVDDLPRYQAHDYDVPAFSASAAISKDGELVVALVNMHPDEEQSVSLDLTSDDFRKVAGEQLTAAEMDAHNTFEEPDKVTPVKLKKRDIGWKAGSDSVTMNIPAKSVTVLRFSR